MRYAKKDAEMNDTIMTAIDIFDGNINVSLL